MRSHCSSARGLGVRDSGELLSWSEKPSGYDESFRRTGSVNFSVTQNLRSAEKCGLAKQASKVRQIGGWTRAKASFSVSVRM